MSESMQALRALSLRYPEATERVASEGAPVEERTIMARDEAFVVLGAAAVRVKLRASLADATRRAFAQPDRFEVGAHGWVTVASSDDASTVELLARWIDESYRLVAPAQRVSTLPDEGLPTPEKVPAAKAVTKKKAGKKKASR